MYGTLDTLSVVARAAYKRRLGLTGHECLRRKALTSLVFSAADLASPIAFSFVVPVYFTDSQYTWHSQSACRRLLTK